MIQCKCALNMDDKPLCEVYVPRLINSMKDKRIKVHKCAALCCKKGGIKIGCTVRGVGYSVGFFRDDYGWKKEKW